MTPTIEYMSWGEAFAYGTLTATFILIEILFLMSLGKENKDNE